MLAQCFNVLGLNHPFMHKVILFPVCSTTRHEFLMLTHQQSLSFGGSLWNNMTEISSLSDIRAHAWDVELTLVQKGWQQVHPLIMLVDERWFCKMSWLWLLHYKQVHCTHCYTRRTLIIERRINTAMFWFWFRSTFVTVDLIWYDRKTMMTSEAQRVSWVKVMTEWIG